MFNIDVEEIQWGGQTLRLETGRVARQADGAHRARSATTRCKHRLQPLIAITECNHRYGDGPWPMNS